MPTWNNPNSGLWTDSANWTGGVPNGVGADADIVVVGGTGATIATFTENATVKLGTLDITSTGARDVLFQGSLADSGSGVATLEFDGGPGLNGVSRVNITTTVGGGEFEISSFGGLQVRIGVETEFNVTTAGTTARINAPIIGSGVLEKLGAGTLLLGSSNTTFDGLMLIAGGTLYALNGGALGDGGVQIQNNAILRASGTVTASVGTQNGNTGTLGNGQIMAPTGTTLTLTGGFGHSSSGILTLGNSTDNGTIAFGNTTTSWGDGSFRLAGGTVRFDTAHAAASVFYGANNTLTELVNGAVLDGRGFQMNIANLDLDSGTIRSSTGAMLLNVNDTSVSANAQTGTIEGTANADKVDVDVLNNFTFASTTFSNWSANDVIQIDGSANANNLTGSTFKDTFNSGGGNDTLIGNGGADIFFAGDNDDLIVLNAQNGSSQVNGGNGTDTLRITGGSLSLQSLSGIEALELQNAATLALSNGQFFSLPGTAAISGTGTVSISLFGGQSALTNNFAMGGGSNITFNIQGAGGNETITIHPDAIGIISDGGGIDTITGGNRGDTITIAGGVDTVNAGAGNDLVAVWAQSNGSHVHGGADTDTLRIADGSVSLSSITGFEAIEFVAGTSLTLSSAQFNNGFVPGTTLSGSGTLVVNVGVNEVFGGTAMWAQSGSTIIVTINGSNDSSGGEAIKGVGGAVNTINGNAGDDQLRGGALGDTIFGGDGDDKIGGGQGSDTLYGGAGADTFRYPSQLVSGIGANADRIMDFVAGVDKLSFLNFDAVPGTPARDALTYVGNSAFANDGTAQIRWVDLGDDLRVEIDSDGNGLADMQILLAGAGAQTLTAGDFML